mgnify:CR=1 FL=1
MLADDFCRINSTGLDQLDQIGNVFSVIAITHTNGQIPVHCLANGKSHVIWWINADYCQGSGFG